MYNLHRRNVHVLKEDPGEGSDVKHTAMLSDGGIWKWQAAQFGKEVSGNKVPQLLDISIT